MLSWSLLDFSTEFTSRPGPKMPSWVTMSRAELINWSTDVHWPSLTHCFFFFSETGGKRNPWGSTHGDPPGIHPWRHGRRSWRPSDSWTMLLWAGRWYLATMIIPSVSGGEAKTPPNRKKQRIWPWQILEMGIETDDLSINWYKLSIFHCHVWLQEGRLRFHWRSEVYSLWIVVRSLKHFLQESPSHWTVETVLKLSSVITSWRGIRFFLDSDVGRLGMRQCKGTHSNDSGPPFLDSGTWTSREYML